MEKGKYLCGCDPARMREIYGVARIDDQGYDVCPQHGERLYGWASPMIRGPQGNNVLCYRKFSKSPELVLEPSEIPDQRDKRDPILIYTEYKRQKEIAANGSE